MTEPFRPTPSDLDNAAALSPAQKSFLVAAADDPRWRVRASFGDLWAPSPLFPTAIQPWPLFVRRSLIADVGRRIAHLTRVVERSLLRRLADDSEGTRRTLRNPLEGSLRELVRRGPGQARSLRADLLDDATSFRCVELNVSGSLGGWELDVLAQRLRRVPFIDSFLTQHAPEALVQGPFPLALHRFAQLASANDGAIVFVGGDRIEELEADFYTMGLNAIALEAMRDDPLPPLYLRRGRDVVLDGEVVRVRGVAEPVAVLVDATFPLPATDTLLAISRCEAAQLYCGPLGTLLSDKRLLGFAYADALVGAGMTDDEALAVREILPPTEIVSRSASPDEMVALKHRSELVLKPASAFGGKGIIIGAEVDDSSWHAAVSTARGEGWVVQQRVVAVERPMLPAAGPPCSHRVAWGWFQLDGEVIGVYPRVMRVDQGSVVNVARGGESAIAFGVD